MREPVWSTEKPPQDGTPIYMRVIQPYRFQPYSPSSSQAKRGEKGRWQMMNEYGGWENCPWPLGNEWSLTHPLDRSDDLYSTMTGERDER